MIGILLEYQPLYIQGPEDPEKGAQACYIGGADLHIILYMVVESNFVFMWLAAVLYLVSMALSIAYWWYDNKRAPATTAGGNLASKYGAVGNGVN